MTTYTVAWFIEIDADSPEDAARRALEIHRDPASIATFFEVKKRGPNTLIDVANFIESNGYATIDGAPADDE